MWGALLPTPLQCLWHCLWIEWQSTSFDAIYLAMESIAREARHVAKNNKASPFTHKRYEVSQGVWGNAFPHKKRAQAYLAIGQIACAALVFASGK